MDKKRKRSEPAALSEEPKSGVCKNCNTPTTDKFCPHCGQSASIKRIDWAFCAKEFIFNNLTLHSGLLYTIKSLLIRPKKMVEDYLNGKRIGYTGAFHFFIVILIFKGIVSLLLGHVKADSPGIVSINGVSSSIDLQQYVKPMLYIFTAVCSLGTYLVYKRRKLRLAEHFFLNFYLIGMCLFLAMVFNLVTLFKLSQYDVLLMGFVLLSYYIRVFYDKKLRVGDFFRGIWCLTLNLFFALILLIIGAIIFALQNNMLEDAVKVVS